MDFLPKIPASPCHALFSFFDSISYVTREKKNKHQIQKA